MTRERPQRGVYVYVHTTCAMEVGAGHVDPPKRGGRSLTLPLPPLDPVPGFDQT